MINLLKVTHSSINSCSRSSNPFHRCNPVARWTLPYSRPSLSNLHHLSRYSKRDRISLGKLVDHLVKAWDRGTLGQRIHSRTRYNTRETSQSKIETAAIKQNCMVSSKNSNQLLFVMTKCLLRVVCPVTSVI